MKAWLLPSSAFVLALASLAGCAPTTPYRYSALVPAARPIPFDGHTSKEGSFHVEGTLTKGWVSQNQDPQIHDTAVHVASTLIEGTASLALTSGLELGAHGAYGAYEWSERSASGTMPLPSGPSLWGIGPELRGSFPLDHEKRFRLGLAGNIMRYSIPYAEWTRTGQPDSPGGDTAPCIQSPTCVGEYKLYDEAEEAHWTLSFGVYPSYALGEQGELGRVFVLFGGHTGFKNDGFTDTPTNGSTVQTTGPVWMFGGGYAIDIDVVHLQALLYYPFTDHSSPILYGPGTMLTVGVNLPTWEPPRSN